MNQSKNVIITGVSGQDGSLMADYLLKNTDHQIYGMVRRSASPDYSNLKEAFKNPKFKLVTGDLGDGQSIDNLICEIKPDYFINFAAQSFVGLSWQLPEQTFDSGAVGVLRCLESIKKHVPTCRFYNAGSSEEFGDVIFTPQNEDHPPRPQSPYGAAKCAARSLVRVYRESYNLYAIQGYLFNHEGVRRGEEFVTRKITKGVARIYHSIKNKQLFAPIELGNLDAKRDWSDSEDFVEGVWMMLNQERYLKLAWERHIENNDVEVVVRGNYKPKEYVLSSNETHTIREFVVLAFEAAGITGTWKGSGREESYEIKWGAHNGLALVTVNPKFYRPAEVNSLHGDSSLIRSHLNWKPKTNFKQLVTKMVESDIKNYK